MELESQNRSRERSIQVKRHGKTARRPAPRVEFQLVPALLQVEARGRRGKAAVGQQISPRVALGRHRIGGASAAPTVAYCRTPGSLPVTVVDIWRLTETPETFTFRAWR
jgi:hypothetical protein